MERRGSLKARCATMAGVVKAGARSCSMVLTPAGWRHGARKGSIRRCCRQRSGRLSKSSLPSEGEAIQGATACSGLPRGFAPRNDECYCSLCALSRSISCRVSISSRMPGSPQSTRNVPRALFSELPRATVTADRRDIGKAAGGEQHGMPGASLMAGNGGVTIAQRPGELACDMMRDARHVAQKAQMRHQCRPVPPAGSQRSGLAPRSRWSRVRWMACPAMRRSPAPRLPPPRPGQPARPVRRGWRDG